MKFRMQNLAKVFEIQPCIFSIFGYPYPIHIALAYMKNSHRIIKEPVDLVLQHWFKIIFHIPTGYIHYNT